MSYEMFNRRFMLLLKLSGQIISTYFLNNHNLTAEILVKNYITGDFGIKISTSHNQKSPPIKNHNKQAPPTQVKHSE